MTRRNALVAGATGVVGDRAFGDFMFGADYDIVSHTGKARRFGFHECTDAEEMFPHLFAEFSRSSIIA
jgi:hypothetical protein